VEFSELIRGDPAGSGSEPFPFSSGLCALRALCGFPSGKRFGCGYGLRGALSSPYQAQRRLREGKSSSIRVTFAQ
jgi:hypothetical protein